MLRALHLYKLNDAEDGRGPHVATWRVAEGQLTPTYSQPAFARELEASVRKHIDTEDEFLVAAHAILGRLSRVWIETEEDDAPAPAVR